MNLSDPFPSRPTGLLQLRTYRAGLLVGEEELIELIEDWEGPNLVVDTGKQVQARLLGGDTKLIITKIGFGTNATAPVRGNTSLTEGFIKPLAGVTFPAANQVRFNFELGVTEANGLAISEFGLIAENNTLYARKTRTAPLHKAADLALRGTWTITF